MKRLTLTLGMVALAAVLAACSGTSAADPTRPRFLPEARPETRSRSSPRTSSSPDRRRRQGRHRLHRRLRQRGRRPAQHHDLRCLRGNKVFKGDIVTNQKVDYQVPALAAGTYTFVCEVHPDMKGTITAE